MSDVQSLANKIPVLRQPNKNTPRTPTQHDTIAIVVLDNNDLAPEFKEYQSLTIEKQIDWTKDCIRDACLKLEKLEPHAMWLIVMREYSIAGKFDKYFPVQFKIYFKREMSK